MIDLNELHEMCDFDLCDTCPIQGACRMLDGMPADMIAALARRC